MREAVIRVAADGSSGSRRALEWALDEAQLRGSAVVVVGVYTPSEGGRRGSKSAAEAAVHATMDDIVAGRPDIPLVSWHVVAGDVADVLARESAHSELLVMGSHDQHGVVHSASASAADLCTRVAACPVVVVPPPMRADRESAVQTGARP
jgi:nucleotide-binding universal stress UspA family protein